MSSNTQKTNNFSALYRSIASKEPENALYKAREASLLFRESKTTLPELDTCFLWETKLDDFCKTMAENRPNYTPVDKPAVRSFTNKFGIMQKLQTCSKNSFKCVPTENRLRQDFDDFSRAFKGYKSGKTTAPSVDVKDVSVVNRNNAKMPSNSGNSEPKLGFITARDQLDIENSKVGTSAYNPNPGALQRRTVGLRRRVNSKFKSPLLSNEGSSEDVLKSDQAPYEGDERLKNIDPKMIELIKGEIMDSGAPVDWSDIAGLEFAKNAIQEVVVWPMLRPDIFTGLRRPPKGVLLFGPPGTGKTLIGKCVASQSKSTFFSISASSLTSKWVGEGEKMVRALFTVARCHQPAVIFIDELDSLLSQRNESEHECSRRIKTEFLVQLDGATTDNEERLLVIGATNRPQELDEAARRRFVKRLYIPLPDHKARLELLQKLISKERNNLNFDNFEKIAQLSDGFSGADIRNLCAEACMGPIRSLNMSMIHQINAAEVRPIMMEDFEKALQRVRSSVSSKDLEQYILWDNTYGSSSGF